MPSPSWDPPGGSRSEPIRPALRTNGTADPVGEQRQRPPEDSGLNAGDRHLPEQGCDRDRVEGAEDRQSVPPTAEESHDLGSDEPFFLDAEDVSECGEDQNDAGEEE